MEPIFSSLRGVKSAMPGYSGGHIANPSYEQVCTGGTGHAEAVQITFDPQEISYRDLLEVFFAMHDPTTPNRQGADVGSQYRSAIYYHTSAQKAAAKEVIASLEHEPWWEGLHVVTELTSEGEFFPAEEYHRDYFMRNPERSYCRAVIAPKLAKLHKRFAAKLGAAP